MGLYLGPKVTVYRFNPLSLNSFILDTSHANSDIWENGLFQVKQEGKANIYLQFLQINNQLNTYQTALLKVQAVQVRLLSSKILTDFKVVKSVINLKT